MDAAASANDLLTAIGWFFSSIWQFFTGITVPGLGISFAALFIALFLAGLGLRLFLTILGGSLHSGDLSDFFSGRKDDK